MKIFRKADVIYVSEDDFQFLTSVNALYTITSVITKLINNHQREDENETITNLELWERSGSSIVQNDVLIDVIFKPTTENSYKPRRLLVNCEFPKKRSAICSEIMKKCSAEEKGYFSEFIFVFYLSLKDVDDIEQTVAKQFNEALVQKTNDTESILRFLDRMGLAVTLLLDGYDELSENGQESLRRLITFTKCDRRVYLRRATLVLTSCKRFPEQIFQYFERLYCLKVV